MTPRQEEVLDRLLLGDSRREAAKALNISYYTANDHIKEVYKLHGVGSRGELMALYITPRSSSRTVSNGAEVKGALESTASHMSVEHLYVTNISGPGLSKWLAAQVQRVSSVRGAAAVGGGMASLTLVALLLLGGLGRTDAEDEDAQSGVAPYFSTDITLTVQPGRWTPLAQTHAGRSYFVRPTHEVELKEFATVQKVEGEKVIHNMRGTIVEVRPTGDQVTKVYWIDMGPTSMLAENPVDEHDRIARIRTELEAPD